MKKKSSTNTFVYELKKILKSKSMVAMTILLTLFISLPYLYEIIIVSHGHPYIPPNYRYDYAIYRKGPYFEILFFTYDSYGNPKSNVKIDFKVIQINPSSEIIMFEDEKISNSSGYVIFDVPLKQMNGSIWINNHFTTVFSLTPSIINDTSYVYIDRQIDLVYVPNNSIMENLMVFFIGPNGTRPNNYGVYATFSSDINEPLSENLIFLGILDNYHQLFALPKKVFISDIKIYINNKDFITVSCNCFTDLINNRDFTLKQLVYDYVFNQVSFLIPIFVIVEALNFYARPRIDGIFEFIYSLPVTKLRIGLSRFFAMTLSIYLGTSIAIAFTSILLYAFSILTIDFDFWYISSIGLIVMIISFLGICMVLASLTSSTGSFLMATISFWFIF